MDVNELLTDRDDGYQVKTMEIFHRLSPKLTGAVQKFLGTEDRIYWDTIERLPKSKNCVRIFGHIFFKPGEVIKTPEKEIVVTEDTWKFYKKLIRLTLPLSLLDSGEPEQIAAYVKDVAKLAPFVSDEELAVLLDDVEFNGTDSLLNNPKFSSLLDNATKPKEVMGFDVSNLTDDQIRRMQLTAKLQTTVKN